MIININFCLPEKRLVVNGIVWLWLGSDQNNVQSTRKVLFPSHGWTAEAFLHPMLRVRAEQVAGNRRPRIRRPPMHLLCNTRIKRQASEQYMLWRNICQRKRRVCMYILLLTIAKRKRCFLLWMAMPLRSKDWQHKNEIWTESTFRSKYFSFIYFSIYISKWRIEKSTKWHNTFCLLKDRHFYNNNSSCNFNLQSKCNKKV